LSEKIHTEAHRLVTVSENGKPETIPLIQAVFRSLGVAAVKGDRRAAIEFSRLADVAEAKIKDDRNGLALALFELREGIRTIFEECDAQNLPRPALGLHPDDIVLDPLRGTVVINGPIGEIEQAQWDNYRERRRERLDDIKCTEEYADKYGRTPETDRQIELANKIIKMVDMCFPDEETRRRPGFNLKEQRAAFYQATMRDRKEQAKEGRRRKRAMAASQEGSENS